MELKKKNYLLISTLIGLFLLSLFLIVLPLLSNIRENLVEFKKYEQGLIRTREEIKNFQIFEDKHQNTQNVQKIKDFFVDIEAPFEFVAFLEEVAKREQVFLKISSFPTEQDIPGLRFLLRGESSFLNFYSFLLALEEAPFLIEIKTLDIREKIEESPEMPLEKKIDISLILKVYARANL